MPPVFLTAADAPDDVPSLIFSDENNIVIIRGNEEKEEELVCTGDNAVLA